MFQTYVVSITSSFRGTCQYINLIGDLDLSIRQAEFLGSRLNGWNLLAPDTNVSVQRKRNKQLTSIFSNFENLRYCNDIQTLMKSLESPRTLIWSKLERAASGRSRGDHGIAPFVQDRPTKLNIQPSGKLIKNGAQTEPDVMCLIWRCDANLML
ncbi:hypothetical protein WA026_009274 [Henosepilachna vigintioctopunctata]|uniref:Uncharacterized protein n=1 Tax=Henosepilachna vigintioctopunctata TaxID=420089 RepID=A0AAW1UW38_9CUCU